MCFCRPILLLAGLLLSGPSASAAIITWGTDIWDHSAGGGPPNSTGWAAGQNEGTTVLASGGFDVRVEVTYSNFGNATGSHSVVAVGGPTLTTTDFGPGAAGAAIGFGSAGGFNGASGSAVLANYSVFEIRFFDDNTNLPLLMEAISFSLGDIDRFATNSWNDYIFVRGLAGGSSVPASLSIPSPTPSLAFFDYVFANAATNPYGFPTGSSFTFAGVQGTEDNPNNGGTFGDLNVDFDSGSGNVPIDTLQIFYMQAPSGSGGAQHAVWLNNVTFTPIPEPSSAWLTVATLAGLLLVRSYRRMRLLAAVRVISG